MRTASGDFGISGGDYKLRKTIELEKPICHPAWKIDKIPNFLDAQLKAKEFLPNKIYNVGNNILPRQKSTLCKERRKLLSDEIIAK